MVGAAHRLDMSASDYQARLPASAPGPAPLRAGVATRALSVDAWIIGALIAAAAAIRFIVIDNQSIWQDEALTLYEARLPFGAMIHTVVHVETTPPLYFVVTWIWARVFGTGEVALRTISALAGIAVVPLAYLSARELFSRRAAVTAGAFVVVNPFMIWYSQEARAYMLLAALSAASFLWFIRARQDPSRRNLGWWCLFSSLALMTHFFAGFLVAPEALWLLWIWRTRLVAIAVGVAAVVQCLMLPFAFVDTSHGLSWIAAVPRLNRISATATEWGASIIYRRATIGEGLIGGAVLVAIVAALLAFGGDARTRRGAKVAAAIAGVVFLAPLALGLVGRDYFLSRNVIPAFVPLAALVAGACAVPRARLLGGALAVALLAMFSVAAVRVQTVPYLQRPNWRSVAHALGPAPVQRAILVADGTTGNPLKIYMPRVNWVQPQNRRLSIGEIDIVGATKRLPLVANDRVIAGVLTAGPAAGPSVPRSRSPRGAALLARFRLNNWVLARFALRHPISIDIRQLVQLAPRYFRHAPVSLLVFFQQPGR